MATADLKRLGRYDIVRELGKGAMGVVYEGVDPRLHRKVAIKTILKSGLEADVAKDYSARFVREARAVARLNHPHIVQVYDFGEEGDVAYIVMEFIKGNELKKFFDANERFELKEAVRIMGELCDALEFAHEAGIIHRDIKPPNVMIDSQGRVKLADFGVARIADTDRTQVERTQAGTMVGTPAYMSPEQITGGQVDRRTDIFSAGIILYQFLTGERPFTGGGAWTIAKKIIQDDPPLPSTVNKALPSHFDAVVSKALAKSADARYQSAREFGAALKRALEGKALEEEIDDTVAASFAQQPGAAPAPQIAAARPETSGGRATMTSGTQEVELEFWRAIKDGNDPDDFDLYVQQFPSGIYAALARRKIVKLRGVAPEPTGAVPKRELDQERREIQEAARREAEARAKLAEEKAKLEATLAQREAEYRKREAEARAKAEAEAKARAEAVAKREAEILARAEAEAKARREEVEKAKKEAEATAAKREAEAKARAEAEARAKAEERAKREAEERLKREAEFAKREAELKKRIAEAPHKKTSPLVFAGIAVLVAAIAAALWFWTTSAERARVAELTAALEGAKRANEALLEARKSEDEARKRLELARQAEEAARQEGDVAKQSELAEQTRLAEAEAKKQAVLVKQREAEAKAKEDAIKSIEAKKKAEAAKIEEVKQAEAARQREAELAKQREAEAARQREAELAKQREAEIAKQRAAELAKQRETELARQREAEAAARRQAEEAAKKALIAKAEAPKKPEPPAKVALTRSERERLADEEAARTALGAAKGQEVVALLKPMVAAPSPSAPAPAATAAPASPEPSAQKAPSTGVATAKPQSVLLYQKALEIEKNGDAQGAVKIYRAAWRDGSGVAAKRLGEIYEQGVAGVPRDYQESLMWYERARKLGVLIETQKGR